jgi:PTH1 family peptidyl-tRNA hydrolase
LRRWLVVGLGNPGEQYPRTRHNIGWWVVNELARRAGTQPKATGSLMAIGVGHLCGQRIALVKPKTYVNLSGKAVSQALQWTGCDAAHTIVVYDDLDMPVGRSASARVGPRQPQRPEEHRRRDRVRLRADKGRIGGRTWMSHLGPGARRALRARCARGEDKRILDETTSLVADAVQVIMTEGGRCRQPLHRKDGTPATPRERTEPPKLPAAEPS